VSVLAPKADIRAHGVRQLLVYCNGSVKAIDLVTIQASCQSSNSARRPGRWPIPLI